MTFLSFWSLIFLFPALILFYFSLKNEIKPRENGSRFKISQLFFWMPSLMGGFYAPLSFFLLPVLRMLACFFLILAIARPAKPIQIKQVPSSGVDVFIALDVSGSMQALDFEWEGKRRNRLEVSKRVLSGFVPQRVGDRLGLVVFGTEAFIQSPLTLDHESLLTQLHEVQIGDAGDATAIGSAIGLAAKRFSKMDVKSKVLILITDGDNTAGKLMPLEAAHAAKELGVKIYTIALGTNKPVPFPVEDPFFGTRLIEQVFPVDEKLLTQISELTNGRFYRASDTEELKKIYGEIDALEKTTVSSLKTKEFTEYYPFFLMMSLFLVVLEYLLRRSRWFAIPI